MRTGGEWPSRSAVIRDGEADADIGEYAEASGPRLLIYSQDGLGLGHLRRTSAIAAEFLHASPDACVLTVSDSPLGTFFGIAPNQDYLKLPSLVKTGPGAWHSLSLPLPSNELLALRRDLICSAALSFRPDIVLVDHMPHGALGELLPTLDALRSTPAKLVLGLRDILDAPHVVRRRWRAEGAYAAIEEHYDLVLVYGSRSVFDVAAQYAWSRNAASRLVYCGYVCTPTAARHAGRIRAKGLALATGAPAKTARRTTNGKVPKQQARLVVAMAGGGADAYPLMDALIGAFPRIRASHQCALAIITGPFMPEAKRRNLQARAQGQPVKVRKSVSDIPSYIAAADVVVAMAGYNTTAEILSIGTPAVLVPRAAPSAEQRMRARLFGERGWVQVVDPDDLSPRTLADAVLNALSHAPAVEGPDLSGLEVAVGEILSLLHVDDSSNGTRPALLEV
jgi:predicted glycosyltransferase